MWTLLIIASCGPVLAQVLPDPKSAVPPNPSLYVISIDAKDVRLEDAEGRVVPFTTTALDRDVQQLHVQAAAGTAIFAVLPDRETTRRLGLRRGPWKVSASATIDRRAPRIEPAESYAWEGCTSPNGWSLWSDRDAALWEFELTAADGVAHTAFADGLLVGNPGCGRSSWSWDSDELSVRVRGHFSDGTTGSWSNALELEQPTLSLARRLSLAAESGHAPYLLLFAAFGLFLLAALALSRDRRPAPHRPPRGSRAR